MSKFKINVLKSVDIKTKDGRLVFENAKLESSPLDTVQFINIHNERKSIRKASNTAGRSMGRKIGR